MKPLPVAPLTYEDLNIWHDKVHGGRNSHGWNIWRNSVYDADRRDAELMRRIMSLGCRFCGSNSMHGEVHEVDCIYVTDPAARRVWLRKGARIIE